MKHSSSIEKAEQKALQKAQRRAKKGKATMKVSGSRTKSLQKLIIEKKDK